MPPTETFTSLPPLPAPAAPCPWVIDPRMPPLLQAASSTAAPTPTNTICFILSRSAPRLPGPIASCSSLQPRRQGRHGQTGGDDPDKPRKKKKQKKNPSSDG